MKIVIVGLGVIGGSFALALKQAGYDDVYGVDTNAETLEKAEKTGNTEIRTLKKEEGQEENGIDTGNNGNSS